MGKGRGGESSAFGDGVGALDHLALAGHDRLTGAKVPPACRERKVVAGHVAVVAGGGHGDGGDLGLQRVPAVTPGTGVSESSRWARVPAAGGGCG